MRSRYALPLCLALATNLSVASPRSPSSPHRPTVVAGSIEEQGNVVRAGSDGAEWALPGGSSVIAAPGAELRVLGKPQLLDLGSRRAVPSFTVLLKQGFVRARVPAHATSAVVLGAPKRSSVLVASGETSVFAGDRLAVANVWGTASVATEGKPLRSLPAGMVEELVDGAARRRALLGAPAGLRGDLVLVSSGANAVLGELAWDAVPGAAGYRLELRDATSDRLRLVTTSSVPALAAGAAELAPGGYRLRVVATNDAGVESGSPLERPLEIVEFELPPGGYIDQNGALRVPAGSRVTLPRTAGLELADGLGVRFGRAPGAIELRGDEPRLVRLRAQGDGNGREIWLFPRRARAHVQFAPQAPLWPAQPLEIRVRVEDENGVAAPWIQARPQVRVGVDPVEVPFSNDAGSLKGTLPGRTGSGPWVVRVEVSDQHGTDLGRDFIEVAARN